ncbi:unnamed protein product [Vitrella brassicaformis CCMP3155]|uniref:Phosphatidylethanolamine-binding protein n=1 Tax=Vitrella brassicaformis (strain CCMP3155) TaxID=1169540 RepID=A0A0G4EZN9_VITBC|nr:unnamed protein product [Vitrella brassicaformis CCMP3155]|eukprot:CEM04481.1 unnamed protein product [Vitrella brassicaformis CCMP3155]
MTRCVLRSVLLVTAGHAAIAFGAGAAVSVRGDVRADGPAAAPARFTQDFDLSSDTSSLEVRTNVELDDDATQATLIMVDPDAPNGCQGNAKAKKQNKDYFHWWVANLTKGKFTPEQEKACEGTVVALGPSKSWSGCEMLEFVPPSPPKGMHRYQIYIVMGGKKAELPNAPEGRAQKKSFFQAITKSAGVEMAPLATFFACADSSEQLCETAMSEQELPKGCEVESVPGIK